MRILWVPHPQLGSICPSVPFVEALLRQGHNVSALSAHALDEIRDSLPSRLNIISRRIGQDWNGRLQPDSEPDTRNVAGLIDRITLEEVEVSEAIKATRADVVFADSIALGGAIAAERADVPCVSYVNYLANESSRYDPLFRPWWDDGMDQPATRFAEVWNGVRNHFDLPPLPRALAQSMWATTSRDCTLLVTHPLMRFMPQSLPSWVHLGQRIPWDPRTETDVDVLFRSLPPNQPNILVSTSTQWQNDIDLAISTEKAAQALGCNVISTIAADHDVSRLTSAVGLFPHSQLIPRVDLVVGVGGMGTSSKAIHYQKPQIVSPRGRDTPNVSRLIEHLGVGVAVPTSPSPEDMQRAITFILENPGFFDANFAVMERTADRAVKPHHFARLIEETFSSRRASLLADTSQGLTLDYPAVVS